MSAERAAPTIETVVTTLNADGSVNCAAMGIEWPGGDTLTIRPFRRTRTLANLRRHGEAVVNLTDDVLLFCQAALGDPRPPTRPAGAVDGAVLADACSWREVRLLALDERAERAEATVEVVATGHGREHLGLSRARLAVVEASILVSRTRLIGASRVEDALAPLQVVVDKTGGPVEHDAMRYVRSRLTAAR